MKFLFVHPILSDSGGAQLAVLWLMKAVHRRGHAVALFCAGDPNLLAPSLSASGINVKIFSGDFSNLPSSVPAFLEALQKENPEIIVAGNFPATHCVGMAKRQAEFSFPILWYCCEPPRFLYEQEMSPHFLRSSVDPKFYFPWTLRWKRKKLRSLIQRDHKAVASLDAVAAISATTKLWVKEIYRRDARLLFLGVGDLVPETPRFPEGPVTFFSPAGISPIKNYDTILHAFASASREGGKKIRFILTGEGLWKSAAEKLARKLGVWESVAFVGNVPREKLFSYYRDCHAVIFVPLDEPFGLVSVEAGLFGKPVIAGNHGGPSEIVLDQETGFLVNPLDRQEIARKMLRLSQSPEMGKKLGEKAQIRIAERYHFERYVEHFEQISRELIKNQSRAAH